ADRAASLASRAALPVPGAGARRRRTAGVRGAGSPPHRAGYLSRPLCRGCGEASRGGLRERRGRGRDARVPAAGRDPRGSQGLGRRAAEVRREGARRAPSGLVDRWDVSYWITECGVATMRVTLISSRSIIVGTLGEISFFQ